MRSYRLAYRSLYKWKRTRESGKKYASVDDSRSRKSSSSIAGARDSSREVG